MNAKFSSRRVPAKVCSIDKPVGDWAKSQSKKKLV
jgi:hypothetical protein